MYEKVDSCDSVSISNIGISKVGISALNFSGSMLDEEISGISKIGIASALGSGYDYFFTSVT